jgi:hypothetical protein
MKNIEMIWELQYQLQWALNDNKQDSEYITKYKFGEYFSQIIYLKANFLNTDPSKVPGHMLKIHIN